MTLVYHGIVAQGNAAIDDPVVFSESIAASTPWLSQWLVIQYLTRDTPYGPTPVWSLGPSSCYDFGGSDDGTVLWSRGLNPSSGLAGGTAGGNGYFLHRPITASESSVTFTNPADPGVGSVDYVIRWFSGNASSLSFGYPTEGGFENDMITPDFDNTAPDQVLTLDIDEATYILGLGLSWGIAGVAFHTKAGCIDTPVTEFFCTNDYFDIDPWPGSFGTDQVTWTGSDTPHGFLQNWYAWTWVEACIPSSTFTRTVTMPNYGYCDICNPAFNGGHGPYTVVPRNAYDVNYGTITALRGGPSIACNKLVPPVHFEASYDPAGEAASGDPADASAIHFTLSRY